MVLNLPVWSTAITITGDLGQDTKYIHFYQFFNFLQPFHIASIKWNHTIYKMLNSLQILVKSFASNIIIDLSYNLNKSIQYKHVCKLFEVGCLQQQTVTEWIGMKSCSKYLLNRAIYGRA